MREYRGDFEVHLTVHAADEAALERFRAWCEERAFKCVRIVLSRGVHVEQPMATWRRRTTVLPAVVKEAEQSAADARHAGLPAVRVKVEAAPHNEEVPVRDNDAALHDARNYFEHHVKLLRTLGTPRDALSRTCEAHGAHLSRNAFRQAADGKEERFVTLRSYGVGSNTSHGQLRRLLTALAALNEQVLEQESEYCVYDSNIDLDAGWLAPSA